MVPMIAQYKVISFRYCELTNVVQNAGPVFIIYIRFIIFCAIDICVSISQLNSITRQANHSFNKQDQRANKANRHSSKGGKNPSRL